MDASEIYSKRLNAKEVIFPQKGEFIFPIADGRIKTPGEEQELRTSTLIRPRPSRGEGHIDFLGESEGSFPQTHDSFPVAGEAMHDFWSMSGSFIYRLHVEPRVALYSPREESFPIPLKYIDVTRTTHTNLDVKLEKRIDDYWNIDGSRDLSDPWTGFTQFTLLDEKAPDGYTWSGGRLTRKQLTSRPDHLWPELWKSMGKNAKLKEKQKWAEEKIHLDNARKLRGIYFVDPEEKEYKETIKNARKKLETSVAPAMPCKIMKNCGSGGSDKNKTKLACILEANESTRMRMGNSEPHNHEDHIAGKGENSLQHYNLVHKFIPLPQAMKIPAAKAAVDKEWEKLETISAWNLTKVKSKKQVIDKMDQKSQPMMNLTARTPSFVSSSASANPGRSSYGYQDPEQPVLDDSAGKPVATSRSNYSQEYGSSWSSQVWKSGYEEHDRSGKPEQNSWDALERVDPLREEHLLGRTAHSARNEETIHERTGKPDSEDAQGKANFEKFIVGSDTTEFVNKVKNQVQIRQKRMSDNAEDCTEHSIIWRMFMATTLNAVTFMGKSYSTMQNVVQNEEKDNIKTNVLYHCTNDPQR